MTKDSRLEKFLKALCSLDYSDLPTPLSHVEVLWDCLVTGEETPDFQPKSRTEKYLMTILGVYDLEDIPKPISRAETLLYKLATGDTDVELEGGAKSRYERLLSEIITNGGVGGNVDFEYVTYVLSGDFNTLYNTVEKSVKSAILKGNTVNCLISVKNSTENPLVQSFPRTLEVGEVYTIFYNYTVTGDDMNINVGEARVGATNTGIPNAHVHNGKISAGTYIGKKVITLPDVSSRMLISWIRSGTGTVTINELYCVQGDYSNIDIPFINAGMQSVKMPVLTTTGKNLFDGKLENGAIKSATGVNTPSIDNVRSVGYIKVNPNASIVLSNDLNYSNNIIYEYDSNKDYIGRKTTNPFTTSENCQYIRFGSDSNQANLDVKYQIEYGRQPTSYEPFKSNILTANEPVELRGIGDVKDELNLITGELTQRVGEIVLDGSDDENWQYDRLNTSVFVVKMALSNAVGISGGKGVANILCKDYVSMDAYNVYNDNVEGIGINGRGQINLAIKREKIIGNTTDSVDVSHLKTYLQSNPITAQYELANESIKTVDLSTLDQDGNKTKLKTFNDITHVSLSSEGLIPEAGMTVVTKILDDISQASTMSLRMNDISDRQNELQNEVDTQSENIDSTMMATTEIYEQTL